MLTLILGVDWTENQKVILEMLAQDVHNQAKHRILLVPELISHDMERRLCVAAGNTCSRFAEVLSFSRLTQRICDWVGCGVHACLDSGGRLVAMASAVRQIHSKLKVYASVETNPEFLSGLVDAVDEFKRCCITSQDLLAASKNTQGAFAQKLEELSLLLGAYDAVCQRGKRDPRDQLTWGLEQLQDSSFAQKHVFYIDGFPDFTRQNLAVISHLIEYSPHVIISLNCDKPNSDSLAFEKAGDTASRLLRIASEQGIPVRIQTVEAEKQKLLPVCNKLFQGKIQFDPEYAQKMRIVQASSIYTECVYAAEEVLTLVHNGARYRDISVVCPDISTYGNAIRMHFQMCGIPTYFAGTEDILEMSVISTVLSALEVALNGFDSKDVLRYIKSALSPLDMESCDLLENYVLLWGIQGRKWLTQWAYHPGGLVDTWNHDDRLLLEKINAARELAIEPLQKLYEEFRKAKSLKCQVYALVEFLNRIQLQKRLNRFADEMSASGDSRNAQILNQLWEILLSALEQLHDVLGESIWDNETFTRLFKLLLSQYDVGTIPPVLDTVMVGPFSAMRCQQVKHLVLIGAAEGKFPSYGSISGVLSEHERKALRQMGVPLTGGAAEGLEIEFSEIYSTFCGASDSVYASCPAGQTSFVFRRLLEMAGGEYIPKDTLGAAWVNTSEAASYLGRHRDWDSAKKLGIEDLFRENLNKESHTLGSINRANIEALYGKKLNLSASQIDKQADCRLAYFLKYGLKAKECKPVAVDPAEFGTYIHYVLEQTAREICQQGGFKKISFEQTLSIAQKHSDVYTNTHFSQIDSQRIAYLFQRNNRELMMVVEELWKELQDSSFNPVDFEVAFGDRGQLAAIQIPGKQMPAQLRGFVDRVDSWCEDGRNYFRVVDYKTGNKDFDYCDVFNGLGLQMLLYLFALEQEGECLLGKHPTPAGVQYFPARVPILSVDGELSDEEVEKERNSSLKRKGLLLHDEDVLWAIENSENPQRLCCRRKKDGSYTGDIATKEQFKLLNHYVFHLLGKFVDDIASGNVTPNPYTRGSSYNACRFCPYGTVCHAVTVEGRRNYKAMSSQKFWDEIEKEMSKNE